MKQLLLLLSTAVSLLAQGEFRAVHSSAGSTPGVSIREIESNEETLTFEYKTDSIVVNESPIDGYCAIRLGSISNLPVPGEPALPFLSQRFIIPKGMQLDSISFTPQAASATRLPEPVVYALEPIRPGGTPESTIPNKSIYNSETLFPSTQADIVTIQKSSGVSIAFVNLFPVQFKGINNELKTTSAFKISLHLSRAASSRSSDFTPIYADRVDTELFGIENPNELNRYSTSRSRASSEAQYLIITNEQFLNAKAPYTVQDLADRREAQGLTSKIVTVESIYSSTDGVDNPQKIRYFLREAYRDWGVEYVLIAGDVNVVPVRELHPQWRRYGLYSYPDSYEDSIELFVPSDFYYQCLDGPYNTPYRSESGVIDNDGRYWGTRTGGENNEVVDLLPELMIGRIPAETPTEFSNWVTKQFRYESIPDNDPRHKNVLFAGEYIGFYHPMGNGYDIMEYAKAAMEEVRVGGGVCSSFTSLGITYNIYETASFDDFPDISFETMYDYDRGKGNRWGTAEIVEKINSDQYGIIQHLGHGYVEDHMHLNKDNLEILKNRLPYMIYSQSCISGRFTEDCIAERLLTESDTYGIWAGVFNTSFGKANANQTDGVAQRLNRNFWNAYFRKENPEVELGKLQAASHLNFLEGITPNAYSFMLYGMYSISLFGDPAAQLKLRTPENQDYLYLTSPVGSKEVVLEKNQKITWLSTENEEVTLTLLAADGTETAIGTTRAFDRELFWKPSDFATEGTGYRMVIKGSALADTSALFSIVNRIPLQLTRAPEGEVEKGEIFEITWNSEEPSVSVELIYNGKVIDTLGENETAESLSWSVADSLPCDGNYRIRLIETNSGETIDSEIFGIFFPMINSFPAVEDFDALQHGTALPQGWIQNGVDQGDWSILSGATPTKTVTAEDAVNTGPSFDHTTGTDGNYCYIEASDLGRNYRVDMLSPRYDFRGASDVQLSFWLHMWAEKAGHMGDFQIAMVREDRPDTILFEQKGDLGVDEWQQKTVSLKAGEGEIIRLRFTGTLAESYASDMAIDDIKITVGEQNAVSVLAENVHRPVSTNELIVSPSIMTHEVTTAQIYHKSRTPFDYRWGLYDHVGNILQSGTGRYYGDGSPVDSIYSSPGYSGAAVLFLESTASDGTKTLHRSYVGFQK